MRWGLYISLALLFITSGAPANAQTAGEEGTRSIVETEPTIVYFHLNALANITLNCSLPVLDKTITYTWKKNEVLVEQVAELKGRYKLEGGGATFTLTARTTDDDYGNYSCARGPSEQRFDVRARPLVRVVDDTNVVEGQKLKLQCKVFGKPFPTVRWLYNASADVNESRPVEAGGRGGRVRLEANEQGVPDAALVLDAAERADAGFYICEATAAGLPPVADATQLRVKDMYAALWPFLGICAEVFVLCAVILVYEKRRTKPELDDSDTDNHDQKKS